MKQLLVIFPLVAFSIIGYAAQNSEKDLSNTTEKTQNKARKILETNFNAVDNFKEKKNNRPNFGFKKKKEENVKENL